MRDGWRSAPLGELVRLNYGKELKEDQRSGAGFPVVGSAGVVGWHHEAVTPDGPSIIVGRKGTAGSVHWVDGRAWPIDTTYWVELLTSYLTPEFAFLLLQEADLPAICAQTGVPGLNRDRVYELIVMFPPLSEQKRIVDLVAAVDAALEAATAEAAAADRARTALLQDRLAAGYPERPLGEIAELEIGKTPPRGDGRYWTDDLTRPFCTIADMNGMTIRPEREGVTELAEREGKAKRFPAGTLLMSFKLTIGRVGFAAVDLFPNEAIVGIRPIVDDVDERYLAVWLGAQDLAASSGRAVKGNTLNKKSLSKLPVSLPPLSEQKQIVDLISAVDAVRDAAAHLHQKVRAARSNLCAALLSGEHVIPESYDELLEAV